MGYSSWGCKRVEYNLATIQLNNNTQKNAVRSSTPELQGCESDCGQWSSKCVRASNIQVIMVAKMQTLESEHPEVSPDSTDLTWIT